MYEYYQSPKITITDIKVKSEGLSINKKGKIEEDFSVVVQCRVADYSPPRFIELSIIPLTPNA